MHSQTINFVNQKKNCSIHLFLTSRFIRSGLLRVQLVDIGLSSLPTRCRHFENSQVTKKCIQNLT